MNWIRRLIHDYPNTVGFVSLILVTVICILGLCKLSNVGGTVNEVITKTDTAVIRDTVIIRDTVTVNQEPSYAIDIHKFVSYVYSIGYIKVGKPEDIIYFKPTRKPEGNVYIISNNEVYRQNIKADCSERKLTYYPKILRYDLVNAEETIDYIEQVTVMPVNSRRIQMINSLCGGE